MTRPAVVVAVVAVALGFGWAEWRSRVREQRRAAEIEARETRRGVALAQCKRAEAALAAGRRLEARARLRMCFEVADAAVARALWSRLGADPHAAGHVFAAPLSGQVLTVDGATVALPTDSGVVYRLDPRTMEITVRRGAAPGPGGRVGGRVVTLSRDGKQAAVGRDDGVIKVWAVAGGGGVRTTVKASDGAINAVAFTRHGRRVISVGTDRRVQIWEVASGRRLRGFVAHRAAIDAVAVSADGRWIATGSRDKTIGVWPLDHDAPARMLRGHEAAVRGVAFSLGGRALVSIAGERRVRVWDLKAPLPSSRDPAAAAPAPRDYCAVLANVWARVPAVWRGKQAVLAPAPSAHRCAPVVP